MTRPGLQLIQPAEPIIPPEARGRLMTAAQVAAEIFGGTVSAAWVRRNVPGKIILGHSTVRWYEADVRAWLESHRNPRKEGA